MKTKLLAFMMLGGAAMLASPSRAQSDPYPDMPLTFEKPDLDGLKAGGKVVKYYIYQPDKGLFLGAGQPYDTHVVVKAEGQEVTISYDSDYELSKESHISDGTYVSPDDKAFLFTMLNAKSNGGYHELFVNDESTMYCDHNEQGHLLFDIEPAGDDLYTIKVHESDPTYGNGGTGQWNGMNAVWGVDSVDASTGEGGVIPCLNTGTAGHENAVTTWKFVSPAVYGVYAAKKNILKPQLLAARDAGYPDLAKYEAVYNDADATAEAVENAAEELKSALGAWEFNEASPENPADMSDRIADSGFKNVEVQTSQDGATEPGKWFAWRANTNGNFQKKESSTPINTSDGHVFTSGWERWVSTPPTGDYQFEQALTGLPNGAYTLEGYVFTSNEAAGLFLYAKTALGEKSAEDTEDNPTPNTEAQASRVQVDFTVIDGNATIGMRSKDNATGWTGAGDFKIYYKGSGGDASIRGALRQNIDDAMARFDANKLTEDHSLAGEVEFNEVIAAAEAAYADTSLGDDSLVSVIRRLMTQVEKFDADFAAYKTLQTLTEELQTEFSDFVDKTGQDLPSYEEYLGQLLDDFDQGLFDPANIDSVRPWADAKFAEAFKETLSGGSDVTSLLNNPDFTGGNAGWSGTTTAPDYDEVEIYQPAADADVYQELTGLPAGSYKVTAQGFYRPSTNDNCAASWQIEGDPSYTILGVLYANDAIQPLHHVFDVPRAEADSAWSDVTGETADRLMTFGGTTGWIVNNMKSARAAFDEGDGTNYLNEVTGYVGEDGKLRLGVKMTGTGPGSHWMLFDNFHVTYLGPDDVSGATVTLEALIKSAQDLLTAAKDEMSTAEAKAGLQKAIDDANGVMGNLTIENYKTTVQALNEAIEAAKEAHTAAQALADRIEAYSAEIANGDYLDYDGTDAYGEFDDYVFDCEEYLDALEFESLAKIEEIDLQLSKLYSAMLISLSDYANATKGKPADLTGLILNPTFQKAGVNDAGEPTLNSTAENWTFTQGPETYSSQNPQANAPGYEFYNIGDSSSISQKLYNAPAGYYRLSFIGIYRAGDMLPAAISRAHGTEEHYAEVYLSAGENEWSELLPSLFEGDEAIHHRKINSGDLVVPDSLLEGIGHDGSDAVYHFVANNPAAVDSVSKLGNAYKANLTFHVAEGEILEVGMRKTGHVTNDWAYVDNFTLEYYGDGDANKPDGFEEPSNVEGTLGDGTAATVSTEWYTIDGVRVAQPAQRGIYIRRDKKADGTVKTAKVLVK